MMNMSYCRFRNTLTDLQDCYNHLEDAGYEEDEMVEGTEEWYARKSLINLCIDIAIEFGHVNGREIKDILAYDF